jgi:4-hydroxy-tetrahydrodipicolinate synthase
MRATEVIVALLTPFRDHGALDTDALRAHVEELAAAGVDGLLVAGTTGEGPLLDDDELVDALTVALDASAGRLSVAVNVGRASTSATIRLARKAVDCGADRLAATTPYYYAISDEELAQHYRALLTATGSVPVLAYTIPARTGNDLAPDTVRELAADGLAGIKDSTKSFARHLEYLAIAEDATSAFSVYMGSDAFAYESMVRGSGGCVSAIANIRPDLLLGLRAAALNRSEAEAEPLRRELLALRERLAVNSAIPSLKHELASAWAARGDDYPDQARPPLGRDGAPAARSQRLPEGVAADG